MIKFGFHQTFYHKPQINSDESVIVQQKRRGGEKQTMKKTSIILSVTALIAISLAYSSFAKGQKKASKVQVWHLPG